MVRRPVLLMNPKRPQSDEKTNQDFYEKVDAVSNPDVTITLRHLYRKPRESRPETNTKPHLTEHVDLVKYLYYFIITYLSFHTFIFAYFHLHYTLFTQ